MSELSEVLTTDEVCVGVRVVVASRARGVEVGDDTWARVRSSSDWPFVDVVSVSHPSDWVSVSISSDWTSVDVASASVSGSGDCERVWDGPPTAPSV